MRQVVTETAHNGRHIRPGTELSITGERGRFRFVELVHNGDTSWITVYGGATGHGTFRSFDPERIRTVHSKPKLR